ncbi:type-F conjugative transfer system protein TrbI [Enterobacter hormaechei]|uniref:Type-F conjugative transfer system protein TrbI n=1 Tax=Citrobacter freundii TaxID=546 RepID=A0ABY7LA20_CITFR|nr:MULTISPECIES: type-F conjugative transfer system protein TrbI [Enterobacteriaceae]HED3823578.1 type-F conjugative transfer system protein TrbI [Enterobacter hormaechei subsp. oharae]EIJ9085026.1 type-F conjugative transfer system protein TrbI [Citrobacter freundii]EKS6346614.1 type-F conjugative transfer system protein TrbI [Enterobacter hormaechei]EKX7629447.1 type-F conjugative transfer system protein TrbI [Enterobacter mori]EKX9690668.1 type-F conjugative transfer system protein TrbI [Ci
MSEQQGKPYDGDTVRDGVTMAGWLTSRSMKLAIFLLVSQMVMTGITWIYMKTTEPEIVVFDMKGTVDLFMQQSAQLQLDENRAKAMTQQFNTALNGSLDAWQSSHNAIILVKPAVMSPQRDITNEIRADIARRIQGGQ